MLEGALKAVLLLQTEPVHDSASGVAAAVGLAKADMVVTLSPFKANMEFSDVLLPVAPFTETPGTFINAEGRVQSFYAVVKPLGETRPAWKVLRVLANLLELPGFEFESSQDVLASVFKATGKVPELLDSKYLGNATHAPINLTASGPEPTVASIYQLDGIVRRATALQLTADARQGYAVPAASGVPA
jgi:NADH-quinone oxidoreductase subunit G